MLRYRRRRLHLTDLLFKGLLVELFMHFIKKKMAIGHIHTAAYHYHNTISLTQFGSKCKTKIVPSALLHAKSIR